jgi:hypothetical protein
VRARFEAAPTVAAWLPSPHSAGLPCSQLPPSSSSPDRTSAAPTGRRTSTATTLELVGFAGHVPDSAKPKVTAYFPRQSYAQGTTAELEITDRVPDVKVQMFRAGMSPNRITANDLMTGNPVTGVRDLGPAAGSRTVSVHLGAGWASGLYYALSANNFLLEDHDQGRRDDARRTMARPRASGSGPDRGRVLTTMTPASAGAPLGRVRPR